MWSAERPARSFVHRAFEGTRFRGRLRLLTLVTSGALALILATTLVLGWVMEERLATIRDTRYPSLLLVEQLRRQLNAGEVAFQNAVAARDVDRLRDTDSLRVEYRATIAAARALPGSDDAALVALRRDFDAFFASADALSRMLIADRSDSAVRAQMRVMMTCQHALRWRLETVIRTTNAGIQASFSAAERAERLTWASIAFIAVLCVLVLTGISRAITRPMERRLARAVAVADALAVGDSRNVPTDVAGDEVGDLTRSMAKLVSYSNELAAAASAIARGDTAVRIAPRSERDRFGSAFASMSAYLRDMTAVAERLGRGDLSVRITPRSPSDVLGHAFAEMLERLTSTIAQLSASENDYRQLMQQAADAVFVCDAAGMIVDANHRAEQLCGCGREAVRARPLSAWLAHDDATPHADWRDLRAGDVHTAEHALRRDDGSTLTVEIHVTRLPDGRILATLIDITGRRQLEEELRQAQKMDAVGRLAGGVAHDFNNILTVIQGHLGLLRDEFAEHASTRQSLDDIGQAATHAEELTRQLLAFSRKQIQQPRLIDLNASVRHMEKMLRRLVTENIAMEVSTADTAQTALVDPAQLDQVLMNLVVNAADAMPDGGTLRISVGHAVLDESELHRQGVERGPRDFVVLSVADTGVGMDAATQRRIFEPFFTTKEVGRGTGLGLATVYGIVQQSGGFVSVRSAVGRGSTFEIYLPASTAVAAPEPPASVVARPTAAHEATVLVVEDDAAIRALVSRALTRHGISVLHAANGQEGLAIASTHEGRIDLALTDVVMPNMSGREFAEGLRFLRPDTPVLFISGYTDDVVFRRGMLDRNVRFLHKPFGPAALYDKIREMLDAAPGAPDAAASRRPA